MSDGQMRMLSSAIIAAAGGITVGLGAMARSAPGYGADDLTAIIVGVLMLLAGGIRWVWALQ
jgi:hypothetical protein